MAADVRRTSSASINSSGANSPMGKGSEPIPVQQGPILRVELRGRPLGAEPSAIEARLVPDQENLIKAVQEMLGLPVSPKEIWGAAGAFHSVSQALLAGGLAPNQLLNQVEPILNRMAALSHRAGIYRGKLDADAWVSLELPIGRKLSIGAVGGMQIVGSAELGTEASAWGMPTGIDQILVGRHEQAAVTGRGAARGIGFLGPFAEIRLPDIADYRLGLLAGVQRQTFERWISEGSVSLDTDFAPAETPGLFALDMVLDGDVTLLRLGGESWAIPLSFAFESGDPGAGRSGYLSGTVHHGKAIRQQLIDSRASADPFYQQRITIDPVQAWFMNDPRGVQVGAVRGVLPVLDAEAWRSTSLGLSVGFADWNAEHVFWAGLKSGGPLDSHLQVAAHLVQAVTNSLLLEGMGTEATDQLTYRVGGIFTSRRDYVDLTQQRVQQLIHFGPLDPRTHFIDGSVSSRRSIPAVDHVGLFAETGELLVSAAYGPVGAACSFPRKQQQPQWQLELNWPVSDKLKLSFSGLLEQNKQKEPLELVGRMQWSF